MFDVLRRPKPNEPMKLTLAYRKRDKQKAHTRDLLKVERFVWGLFLMSEKTIGSAVGIHNVN